MPNVVSITMPSFWESFISLSPHPNRQHDFALSAFESLLVFQPIPLRRQWAIWRHSKWNLCKIEVNPAHKIILRKVLIFHHDFKQIRLQPFFREGEDLIPDGGDLWLSPH
ncbi:unnamed protein product [Linum tenue]|uniref:Uncharacterized protein n=1 Tax=Linum tenue TaxID=586396 RepID=A0AAV0IGM4_9ROSI|nr:unnamed protein product [Linum tenue]